uniref:hypothetical protein n=1 Tax=Haloprofundus sp. MHR1 TaxID=2572921 RepID=UPI001F2DA525|nr:hypothetical protein [Haloprofundus sp. MHR1]
MKRRQFLGRAVSPILVSAGMLSVAGCLSESDASGASVLGAVVITNRNDERHIVDFRVRWDGETVHESTHEVEGRTDDGSVDGAVPAKTWPDEPGQFTVSARTQGSDWNTVNPADRKYPECYGVTVAISEEGRLVIYTATNEYECSDEALQYNREAANESNASAQTAPPQS